MLRAPFEEGAVDAAGERRARRRSHRQLLSRAQQHLWRLAQEHEPTCAYVVVRAFRLAGSLDVAALRDALLHVQQRHDLLRARFEVAAPAPVQHIEPAPLTQLIVHEAPCRLADLAESLSLAPFDPAREPLFRAELRVLQEGGHALLLVTHALACDESSMELLLRDLMKAYEQRIQGRFVELERSGRSYTEYVDCEATRDDEASREDVAFFQAALRNPPVLELPLERARSTAFSRRGGVVRTRLDADLVARVRERCIAQGVALEVALLAAYHALLSRVSGQADVLVGAVQRHCVEPGFERTVGCFDHIVPIRADVADSLSFATLLARAGDALAQASARGVANALLRELVFPLDASRTPLVQALFAYRSSAFERGTTGPLTWERLDLPSSGARADVALVVEGPDGELRIRLEYAAEALNEASARMLLESYRTLLRSAAEDPSETVSRLRLLSEGERARLDAVNRTERPHSGAANLADALGTSMRTNAARVAVHAASGVFTFGELDRRSDELAAALVQRGVGKGARVGVCTSRDRDMVAAVIAVLKAGAAFVPLDPDLPRDRLEYIANDAELALVLTESALRARLPSALLALPLEQVERSLEAFCPPSIDPEDIAYVIYTSGSTGRPKGVQIPHRAVVNFLESMAIEPGFRGEDVLLAVTTLSFDISVLELFLPLLVGGRVVIATREQAMDGAKLSELLRDRRATMMQATPSTWRLLLDHGWVPPAGFKALCGGEAFPPSLARELCRGTEQVWNMYGPTETTVWSTCGRIEDPALPITVGRPIANTQVYVLDANLARVPFGVQGELYIGGQGVAAGYLKRPELTTERFVEDPFRGGRMYRTGDLARQWPHGLQIVGRTDHQVKLRGHRIELGEIETALSELENVRECAVVVREIASGDQRLLAFVEAKEGELDERAVRTALRARLPEYMVPQHYIALDALPHTPNGKIDRKALPAPRELPRASPIGSVAPESALERLLLDVWRKVLRVNEIGVTDSFFESGGHSLLAVQLMKQISEAVGTALPLSLAFTAPTVREQAHFINSGRLSEGASVVPLATEGDGIPLFCICGINLYQSLASALGDERPVYGVFLPAEAALLTGKKLNLCVREMARDYVAAIRSKQPTGPYNLAGVSFGGVLAYEVAQQLKAGGDEVLLLAILDVVLDEGMHLDVRAWSSAKWKRLTSKTADTLASRITRRSSVPPPSRDPESEPNVHSDSLVRAKQELARLDDVRQRAYDSAWRVYKRTMRAYDGNVLVCRAEDQSNGEHGYAIDFDCGWSHYVRGTLWTCEVPGDHLGILDEPNVHVLAEELQQKLRALAPECVRYSSIPPATPGLEVRPFLAPEAAR